MKTTLLLAAALACSTSAAFAADIMTQEPIAPEAVVEPVAYGWDGGYLGIFGGAGFLRGDYDFGPASTTRKSTGGMLGGFAGWNAQLDNNIVLGIEGDFSYNWNSKSFQGYEGGTDWTGSVRGRLGYALDDALIYGTAGWTATRAYLDPPGAAGESNRTLHGYTVGAGVDYKLTESMFARGEYRFSDFGDRDIGGTNVDLKQHAIILGVGFKF